MELTRDDPGATLPEYWDASIMLEGFASVVGDIAFRTREDAKRWAERMCRVMATVRGW